MSKERKPLNDILGKYNKSELSSNPDPETPTLAITQRVPTEDSLTSQLANPKKKTTKIRFTLDLDKPLDDRLNKSAKHLNRSKADLARIALERLLEELEREWKQ
jgi:hypothetical protein